MINELILAIDEITRFGLYPNVDDDSNEQTLEKCLVKIYNLYFDVEGMFDEMDYTEFDKSNLTDIPQNVQSNFGHFGSYKIFMDTSDMYNECDFAIGCAIDDLSDIIYDLLEVKWRIENNSAADGVWHFKMIFPVHTRQHIICLLKFINENC